MTLDEIKERINISDKVLILAHEMPDGDAIGSALAMCIVLKNLGKDVVVLMKNFPSNFSYLPGRKYIKESIDEDEQFDLAIALDCPSENRLNKEFVNFFENAKYRIQFDHHNKNTMYADLNIVNHVSPAACQLLVSSFEYMGFEITKEVATCLITGIITDTNGFRNEGVTTETFEFASWVLNQGINFPKLYRDALLVVSKTKFEVQKLAMNRMEFFGDGRIAFTYFTKKDAEKLHIASGDRDGIVEIGRNIEGVEVSIFLYEYERGLKASLRSNDYVNVEEVCILFGGGGHRKASATLMMMPFEEAKKRLIEEVTKKLK